jgi:hypothetical protein
MARQIAANLRTSASSVDDFRNGIFRNRITPQLLNYVDRGFGLIDTGTDFDKLASK